MILAKLKILTKGHFEEFRFLTSTFFGQTVDNRIFYTGLAFVIGWFGLGGITSYATFIFSTVLFCTFWELFATPITRKVIKYVKEVEGIDTYDHGTNFSPFKLH